MANIVRVPVGSRRANVAPTHRSQYGIISSTDPQPIPQLPKTYRFVEQTGVPSDGDAAPEEPPQPSTEKDFEDQETQGETLYDDSFNASTSYDPRNPDGFFHGSTAPLRGQDVSTDDDDPAKTLCKLKTRTYLQ